MTGIYDTHHHNYRCRDCGYEAKVEDIVVDSFPPSPRSKHRMPELQCFCGGDLCYVKEFKVRTEGALCSFISHPDLSG